MLSGLIKYFKSVRPFKSKLYIHKSQRNSYGDVNDDDNGGGGKDKLQMP
jgi:hypothetical protein